VINLVDDDDTRTQQQEKDHEEELQRVLEESMKPEWVTARQEGSTWQVRA